MNRELARRAAAEALGTGLLVTVVVGSGTMAQRLFPSDVRLELLENSTATMLGLAALILGLILILGPVSGTHFNPVVTLADYVLNRRARTGVDRSTLAAFIPAQIVGGIGGAVLANLMFDLPVTSAPTHVRTGGHLWLGEVVATAGLVLLIFALARTGRGASSTVRRPSAPTLGRRTGSPPQPASPTRP